MKCTRSAVMGRIPGVGMTKTEKRAFRRRCMYNSFEVRNGQLYHRQFSRGKEMEEQEHEWKLCVKTKDEKERIFVSCHSSAMG